MRKKNLVRPHIFYTLWLKFRDSRNIFLFIVMNIFLCFKNAYFLVSSCILSFIFMTVLKRNELRSKQNSCFFFLSLVVAWLVFKQSIYRKRFHHVYFCFFSVSWSPTNSLVSCHPLIQFSLANSVNYCRFWIIIYLIWKNNIVAANWSIFFFIECMDFFFFAE